MREREKEKERKRKRERKLVGRGGIAREGDSRCNDVSALQRPRARVRSLSFSCPFIVIHPCVGEEGLIQAVCACDRL